MCWTVQHCDNLKNKNQLDATYHFIVLLIGSTCFGHCYAHHQEPTSIMLIITLVVSFCKDGRSRVNVKLWFLVVYRVSQEECARIRESVSYVKVYRYNPKHLYPKLNGYGDNGQRNLKL